MTLTNAKDSIVARKRAQVLEMEAEVAKLAETGDELDRIGGMRTIIWLVNMEIRDLNARDAA